MSALFNSSRQTTQPSSTENKKAGETETAPTEKSEEDEEDEALANTIFWASLVGVAAVSLFLFRKWRH